MPKRRDSNAWFQQVLKVSKDPAISSWLKIALVDAINRDPVDAARDSEILCKILQLRAASVQQARALSNTNSRLTKSAS
jgi:hypothetical protein